MKNRKQQDQNGNWDDLWDQGTYQTGSTEPPKKRSGLVAVLLGLVIFLSGIVSALGILNIHPLQKDPDPQAEEPGPVSFYAQESTEPSLETETISSTAPARKSGKTDSSFTIQPSPESVPNMPQEGGLSYQEIYKKTIDSVVSIVCTVPGGSASGTGVVISQDGYVVTNCHVVADATGVSVLLNDDRMMDAEIMGMDSISDLAVLKIQAEHLVPAVFGDSDQLQVGDAVVAIGDPLGVELRGTMTNGIISAIQRNITTHGRTMNVIQTNAALNSGNSGGPLINCYGQVVGINTMKIGDYMAEGLGFAIPSTTVRDVVDQLISKGYVSGRPTLGIEGEYLSPFYLFYYDLPQGLHITEIDPESDAYQQGVRADDILLSVDGTRITNSDVYDSVLYSHSVGDTVEAIIYRSGKQYSLTLTLQEATG